ncbi:hypothetical protein WJX79_005081 [Trebouxia sp. C0005]
MSATQDPGLKEHTDREHQVALNRRTAARSRKRKQNEIEQLFGRINALELANAVLSRRLRLRETEKTSFIAGNAARLAGDSLLSGWFEELALSLPPALEQPPDVTRPFKAAKCDRICKFLPASVCMLQLLHSSQDRL